MSNMNRKFKSHQCHLIFEAHILIKSKCTFFVHVFRNAPIITKYLNLIFSFFWSHIVWPSSSESCTPLSYHFFSSLNNKESHSIPFSKSFPPPLLLHSGFSSVWVNFQHPLCSSASFDKSACAVRKHHPCDIWGVRDFSGPSDRGRNLE